MCLRIALASFSFLGYCLVLVVTTHAGTLQEPPTAGERMTGPPIEGVFTAIPGSLPNEVVITFSGSCRKLPVSFGPAAIQIAKPFANIISEDIENQIRIQSSAAQATCFPSELGVLIVSGVTKFNNNGVVVGADVSISLIQAK